MYNLTTFLQGIYYITAYIIIFFFTLNYRETFVKFEGKFSSGLAGQWRLLVSSAFRAKAKAAVSRLEPFSYINYENVLKNISIASSRAADTLLTHTQMIRIIRIKILCSV